MTTSMYCLYVGVDYTYIDVNALAQGIKSFLASQVWFQVVAGARRYGTDSYVRTYLRMYVCMYIRMSVHVFTHVCICMYACVCMYVCVCMCVCIYVYMYACMHYVCKWKCMCVCIDTYMCVCMCECM